MGIPQVFSRRLFSLGLFLFLCLASFVLAQAQTETTGAFRGRVVDEQGKGLGGASVQVVNKSTGIPAATRTDESGNFTVGLLLPGVYTIRVNKPPDYIEASKDQRLVAVDATTVLPEPFILRRGGGGVTPPPTTTQSPTTDISGQMPSPTPQPNVSPSPTTEDVSIDINTRNARRSGVFTDVEVSTLPLGATTLIRTFDELALLLPGVALPPQTEGDVAGPGVGSGVGSAGQFAVNGLRSRANNFTVDGSDNNDEDIGVRRQGFLALVPQPIESIQEYQVTTLLAPAQFGRNIGAQVNAVSKSGGNKVRGTLFGFFNSRELNAREFFDTTSGLNNAFQLRSNGQPVLLDGQPLLVRDQTGGRDTFNLAFGGFTVGGPIKKDKAFFFVSGEKQNLNATQEKSFAVPTVAERGAFGTGASGLFFDPFGGTLERSFPTSFGGDAIFALFPFPNNPGGIFGQNTFTQVLPANGRGTVFSAKTDFNFKAFGNPSSFTARYNITDDERDIPVTGNALFSTLHPDVRTQNFSTFFNTELTGPDSTRPVFNQLRLSYGRTRLVFREVRDREFQVPSELFPNTPFLLNAPFTSNFTLPPAFGVPNTGAVSFVSFPGSTTENFTGPVGQVNIAGFNPLGVDVFNFPQSRVNNTYQIADTMTMRVGTHSFAFGTDIRRTELNSDLPRNARPLLNFGGAPRLIFSGGVFRFARPGIDPEPFLRPTTLAAAEAPSGFFQTISTGDSKINLRYYQYNFFVQDEWRIRPNFSLSYGVRYEYNSPPKETSGRIENTFNSTALNLVPGLGSFINGRTGIFDPDKNNFAPRVGFAYSPRLFGDKTTVIRAGYGLYFDQILGAVVSQSRNVFPTALTVNLAGGTANLGFPFGAFDLLNPSDPFLQLVAPGTLNRLDPAFTLQQQINFINFITGGAGILPTPGGFGVTLPARRLDTPMAHHYALTIEQQIGRSMVFSAAYVGTQGRNLLRITTPNLGPNAFIVPLDFDASGVPGFFGIALQPGTRISPTGLITGGRPVPTVGSVNIYETTATSRYDALQLQLRGRYKFIGSTQFQVNYTFSKVTDDVSDVFDLAGAPALPQNSFTFAGERAPANFDARHRISYSYVTDLPQPGADRSSFVKFLFSNIQFAGTGIFQTGQPFTVNSIFDVNLDGNLTDRLDNTTGLIETGDRQRPLALPPGFNRLSLLAAIGSDGRVPRNSFRSSNLMIGNIALIKKFQFTENQNLVFRMDVFNVLNRANFGIPVRFLESPGFGQATDTITPGRRIQLALKFNF
jgi:hypothetical protein